uniref:Calsyntenin-1 n=2 Tax=Bursaphelenchus xylophilus TaxID=6326 RepID=A0A1I7RLE9_BURXY
MNLEKDNDITMLLAIALSLAGIILALSAMIALVVGLHRRKWMNCRSHRAENTAETPPTSTENSNPSIHTVGDRRFYLLPEARINVIEAPPTYADALKQRIVGERRDSVYENGAFHYHREESDKEDDVMMTSGHATNRTIEAGVERFVDESLEENNKEDQSESGAEKVENEETRPSLNPDITLPSSSKNEIYSTPTADDNGNNHETSTDHRAGNSTTIKNNLEQVDLERPSEEWV